LPPTEDRWYADAKSDLRLVLVLELGSHVISHLATSCDSSPNWWEPVRFDRYETGQNSKFKIEIKKMKNSQKIHKNTSRCDESNGVKLSQKFGQ